MPMKTAKGMVALFDNNGRLWARWQGKRFALGLGVPDTPTNRKAVAGRIHQIERDIAYNEFDPTLERYKAKQHKQPKVGMALSLWLEYVNYRSPMVAVNTGIKSYAQVTSALQACPIHLWTEGLSKSFYC